MEAISPDTESLIIQLVAQQRYSEAFALLNTKKSHAMAAHYNSAICLYWSGNFQAALSALANIQLPTLSGSITNFNTNSAYQQIRTKQNQNNDHLLGISDAYIKHFPTQFQDSMIRLQTDCWLGLGNYPKVITTAQPIAHKGYQNITHALKLAATAHDERI